MTFCTDSDLTAVAADVRHLVPAELDDWSVQRALAEEAVLRDLSRVWYGPAARARGIDPAAVPLDPSRLTSAEIKPLAVLKSLEVVYGYLAKPGSREADGFERSADRYHRRYGEELNSIATAGLAYDWDASGVVETGETSASRTSRRLARS